MFNNKIVLLAIAKQQPDSNMDDNLLAAYIDGKLSESQHKQVSLLLARNSSWRQRWIAIQSAKEASTQSRHHYWQPLMAMAASVFVVIGVWFYPASPPELSQPQSLLLTEKTHSSTQLAYQAVRPDQWQVFLDSDNGLIIDSHKLLDDQLLFRDLALTFKQGCPEATFANQLISSFKAVYSADYQAIVQLSTANDSACDLQEAMKQYARLSVKGSINKELKYEK